ncbi:MAG TPA: isocitrate/isopropylmalate family dehydrogenase [Gaiellaceae bacterium]|nr:isocitrate/isopropylmalate family dehydrogenase [Gaiellaceae bacterium]
MSRSWKLACLAGGGVGPELMAESCRVLTEVARLHALHLDDVHLPFGGEAMTRFGHPLPQTTREAYAGADAIFVTSPDDPALDGVKSDLDLVSRVSRVHNLPRGDLVVVEPVGYGTDEVAIARAFQLARARRARLTSVGSTSEWSELVSRQAEAWDGLELEHLTLGQLLTRFRDHPGTVDLVVAPGYLAEAIVDVAAHIAGSLHTVACGWVSETGPGVFAPHVCESDEVAGFGVADPVGTLLAASLLLGEGLGLRSAARTLERAVAAAEQQRTSDTKAFTDAVIEQLPGARTDTEHFQEVNR